MRLALKELRETLRDRRTIATLLLMPILVYPLLSVAFRAVLAVEHETGCRATAITSWACGRRPRPTSWALHLSRERRVRAKGRHSNGRSNAAQKRDARPETRPTAAKTTAKAGTTAAGDPPADASPLRPSCTNWSPNPRQSVLDGRVDVAVEIKKTEPFATRGGIDRAIDCELFYDPQSPTSREALALARRLPERGQPAEPRASTAGERGEIARRPRADRVSRPVEAEARRQIGDPAAPSLATLVPLILILMTITGAVYPAIDLTAGERERGTLETLIASPVPRMQLLWPSTRPW